MCFIYLFFFFLNTNKNVKKKNNKSVSYDNRNININTFALYMKLTLLQIILDTQRQIFEKKVKNRNAVINKQINE